MAAQPHHIGQTHLAIFDRLPIRRPARNGIAAECIECRVRRAARIAGFAETLRELILVISGILRTVTCAQPCPERRALHNLATAGKGHCWSDLSG